MTKEYASAAVLKRLAEAGHGAPMGTVAHPSSRSRGLRPRAGPLRRALGGLNEWAVTLRVAGGALPGRVAILRSPGDDGGSQAGSQTQGRRHLRSAREGVQQSSVKRPPDPRGVGYLPENAEAACLSGSDVHNLELDGRHPPGDPL